MRKPGKLIALLTTLLLSHSATAVIIEGSFSGQMWDYSENNMYVTPEAKFWNYQENAYNGFTGTFWYDTEAATQTGLAVVDGDLTATYTGSHNWLHTTLIGANGGTIDLTSSGSLGTFGSAPNERIQVANDDDRNLFLASYDDRTSLNQSEPHRTGSFSFDSELRFLNDLSLIQDYSYQSIMDVVGYVYFDTSGTLNGVDYNAMVFGEINNFEIHIKQPATVPEPSSLALLLGPVLLLLWRAGLLRRSRSNISD